MKHCQEEIRARKAILAFFGAGEEETRSVEDEYCKACKAAKRDNNCKECDRNIRIIEA